MLALKPFNDFFGASWWVKGFIDCVDTRSVPLDAPSCAPTLEHGLCSGRACGKDLPDKTLLPARPKGERREKHLYPREEKPPGVWLLPFGKGRGAGAHGVRQ